VACNGLDEAVMGGTVKLQPAVSHQTNIQPQKKGGSRRKNLERMLELAKIITTGYTEDGKVFSPCFPVLPVVKQLPG
jgi:hypothetical protein